MSNLPICEACGMTHDLVPYCIDRPAPVYPKRGEVVVALDADGLEDAVERACVSWHGGNHWRAYTDDMRSVWRGNMRAALIAAFPGLRVSLDRAKASR